MPLDQEHRLEEVFSAARNLPPQERAAFLKGACRTMQNGAGKRIRCLPRVNTAPSLPNVGQKCGNV